MAMTLLQFALIALQFYYSRPLLSRKSKYIRDSPNPSNLRARVCFIEALIVADVLNIKILRLFEFIVYAAAQTFAAPSWCSAHKPIKYYRCYLYLSEKKCVIQLPQTQVVAFVSNYLQRGIRTHSFIYRFYIAQRTGEKRFYLGNLIYLYEISFYVSITYY